ncbi:MAG: NADP-dependent oxidoreductase [Rhodocyclales bacterium]|nr:NADP-dependent oxidoreductase [Rhodocyclales bacterium]
MKAWRLNDYGDAGTFVLDDVPIPEPGPTEVLIRVAAASINPLDLKLASGVMKQVFPLQFPYTGGTDVAGTIEHVGSQVTNWQADERVIVRALPTKGGAFAEYVVAAAANVARIPQSLPFLQASGLPTAAGTAWQALFDEAHLAHGQSVLVHAGGGGVGSFAIQFAKAVGAKVIATTSADGVDLARRLGASEVIDYRATDFRSKASNVDVVLDTIGGDTQVRSFDVLRHGGVLVSLISPPETARAAELGVRALRMAHQSIASRLETIASLCSEGRVKVVLDSSFSFNRLPEALTRVASGHAKGKVAIAMY